MLEQVSKSILYYVQKKQNKVAAPLASQRSQNSRFVCPCAFPSLTENFARTFKSVFYIIGMQLSVAISYYIKKVADATFFIYPIFYSKQL